MSECPSQEELREFSLGRLSEEDLARVSGHTETCPECLAALSTIDDGGDSLVAAIRDSTGSHPILDESGCQEAVARFERITCSPPSAGSSTEESSADLPRKLGRYELLEELGRGGMGTVYLAFDSQLDRQVALKVPHFRPNENSCLLERFYREARAAAQIEHPNLCPLHDVGEIDGVAYLSMSYIEGTSLAKLLKRETPFPQRRAAQIVHKLALGLEKAHQRGIVHRDIKPSNVMITEDGEPVLTDFGLAQRLEVDGARLTHSGLILGTPSYMAPEQADGDLVAVGPKSDVYSLGVMLYELLTGRVPFCGSLLSVLSRLGKERPAPPSAHRPDLDPRLEAICLKAMAKRPASRFQSAAELADALNEYLNGRPEPQHAPRRRSRIALPLGAARSHRSGSRRRRGSCHARKPPSAYGSAVVATVSAVAFAVILHLVCLWDFGSRHGRKSQLVELFSKLAAHLGFGKKEDEIPDLIAAPFSALEGFWFLFFGLVVPALVILGAAFLAIYEYRQNRRWGRRGTRELIPLVWVAAIVATGLSILVLFAVVPPSPTGAVADSDSRLWESVKRDKRSVARAEASPESATGSTTAGSDDADDLGRNGRGEELPPPVERDGDQAPAEAEAPAGGAPEPPGTPWGQPVAFPGLPRDVVSELQVVLTQDFGATLRINEDDPISLACLSDYAGNLQQVVVDLDFPVIPRINKDNPINLAYLSDHAGNLQPVVVAPNLPAIPRIIEDGWANLACPGDYPDGQPQIAPGVDLGVRPWVDEGDSGGVETEAPGDGRGVSPPASPPVGREIRIPDPPGDLPIIEDLLELQEGSKRFRQMKLKRWEDYLKQQEAAKKQYEKTKSPSSDPLVPDKLRNAAKRHNKALEEKQRKVPTPRR
jgi:serine/threonine protein kinase